MHNLLSEPQRALVSTISAGQEAIDNASSLLNEKAKLPPLGNDPASIRFDILLLLLLVLSSLNTFNQFVDGRRPNGTLISRLYTHKFQQ